jgi:prespore-specific regulator
MKKKTCLGGRVMSIARQDAWNQDEDLLLAEVVLRHIREGSTQLKAFEEVGRQLSRTSAACGFRWNSFVRKQYKSGIEHAKKQRKESKVHENSRLKEEKELQLVNEAVSELPTQQDSIEEVQVKPSLSFQNIIGFLKEKEQFFKRYEQEKRQHSIELEKLQMENKQLRNEIQSLQTQLMSVEEDYRALLQIMERARKLIVHEEDKVNSKVKFQMDKNGNLERVNK